MNTYGTYFVNDEKFPLRYGKTELINPARQRLRGEPAKEGGPGLSCFLRILRHRS